MMDLSLVETRGLAPEKVLAYGGVIMTTESSDPDRSFVASLDRGLRVIAAFDSEHPVLTVTQAAGRAGISRAAARRFLLTLQHTGFVATDDGQRYNLTPKVLSLGYAYLSSLRLEQHAIPALKKVMHEIGCSCSMAVLSDTHIVYIVRVDKPASLHMSIRIGERLPAFSTALGRILLSGRSDQDILDILKRSIRQKSTPETVIDIDLLVEIIRSARDAGWSSVINQQMPGWTSLAVPVRNAEGRIVAAINASTLGPEADADFFARALPLLQAAASEIEWAIRSGDAMVFSTP
jgi:IclR family pca regulon transcriptional regulator